MRTGLVPADRLRWPSRTLRDYDGTPFLIRCSPAGTKIETWSGEPCHAGSAGSTVERPERRKSWNESPAGCFEGFRFRVHTHGRRLPGTMYGPRPGKDASQRGSDKTNMNNDLLVAISVINTNTHGAPAKQTFYNRTSTPEKPQAKILNP